MTETGRGLILAAPMSGSGKTVVTLGILRALAQRGHAIRSAKSGPDYIDPRFHAAATGRECVNLDAWAMAPDRIRALAQGPGLLLIEGAMGLFDGAPPDGRGATADLARILNLPVVLVVDAAAMAQSIAPLVAGFAAHRDGVHVGGVILNRVGSSGHELMLRRAIERTGMTVVGALPRDAGLALPSRHLGLVQAQEHAALSDFLDHVAEVIASSVDLDMLPVLARDLPRPQRESPPLSPPGQRIAIARDAAFAFVYTHMLDDWRRGGADISFFSPLADESPAPGSDFVFLPGGYPELHGARLAASRTFLDGLRRLAARGVPVHGECGGYMVLGEGLIDAQGHAHRMAGLLALETSLARPRLHLGYRRISRAGAAPGAPPVGVFGAHEFHYATTLRAEGDALFQARDAQGRILPPMGLVRGNVSGSFAHVIDRLDGRLMHD